MSEDKEINKCEKEFVERMSSKSLSFFAKSAWPILEPKTNYIHGWHIDAICEHLEAISNGQIKNLLINIPPRHMKSLLVSVFWPVWEWITKPHIKWLFSSYAQNLSTRDSVKCRRLIQSPWYQNYFGKSFEITTDQNEKRKFENNKTGYRIATSVGGVGTGEGGDRIVCDDPHKISEAHSDVIRNTTIQWWNEEMSTRCTNPKETARVVIMQRIHENDLSGELLTQGDYEHLCLPARFEENRKCMTIIGWEDPRKKDRELLWSDRFGEKEIKEIEKSIGSHASAGQLQQRPSPKEGNIIKRHWWRYYDSYETLPQMDIIIQSWDMTFKETKDGSFVCGQIWGKYGANKYLLDQIRERMDFVATLRAFRNLSIKWPKAKLKLVEDKANGPAVISTLKNEISGIVAVSPHGTKEARLVSVSPAIESGNIYLPSPKIAHWINYYIEELSTFPNSANSDQADCTSQALERLDSMNKKVDAMPISMTRESAWMGM